MSCLDSQAEVHTNTYNMPCGPLSHGKHQTLTTHIVVFGSFGTFTLSGFFELSVVKSLACTEGMSVGGCIVHGDMLVTGGGSKGVSTGGGMCT